MSKIAICIGVGRAGSRAVRLPFLGGALNGARAFHAWAQALGYSSHLITDDDKDVTIDRLRDEIEAALPKKKTIGRLILYFAGHGLIREINQGLWLLSDWDTELRAVAVDGLQRRLCMYDIKQIAMFSDACRSLPQNYNTADLTADKVLGKGPNQTPAIPAIDSFIAAQDTKESYMVPGPTEADDRCLFSGVLLEGLWGLKKEAFSKLQPTIITSQSLGDYLRSEVPRVAQRYKRTLDPNVNYSFPQLEDVYFGDVAPATPAPQFGPWPTLEQVTAMTSSGVEASVEVIRRHAPRGSEDAFSADIVELSIDRPRTPRNTTPRPPKKPKKAGEALLKRIRAQKRPQSFETRSGFAVEGVDVKSVWTTADSRAGRKQQDSNWWHIGPPNASELVRPLPALIEFADHRFAAVAALPRFITSVLCDQRGVSALIYRPVGFPPDSNAAAEQAMATLENGALRPDLASDLATALRYNKHYDPVLGVISAYLYDSIGDIANIRRMAYYYIEHSQPVPYDIALLARIPARQVGDLLEVSVPAVDKSSPRTKAEEALSWTYEATSAANGVVGGLWPWMRQGWAFLDDSPYAGSSLIAPELEEVSRHLLPARFTTFNRDGANELAGLFGLASRST
jgi:hypothetical protein